MQTLEPHTEANQVDFFANKPRDAEHSNWGKGDVDRAEVLGSLAHRARTNLAKLDHESVPFGGVLPVQGQVFRSNLPRFSKAFCRNTSCPRSSEDSLHLRRPPNDRWSRKLLASASRKSN